MAASFQRQVSSVFRKNLFKDKVAVVTGGATGIGKAIAKELLYLGCNVMIASRKPDRLKDAVSEMRAVIPGCKVSWRECNIRKEDSVHDLMKSTIEEYGKIDFLVNNGGGQFYSAAAEFNLKGWNAVIETNLTGTFLCCKQAYHQWMAEHGGSIVSIIIDLYNGIPGMSHSSAARAGVENLHKTLAIEWADNKIRLNCIAPGNSIKSSTAQANYGEAHDNIFERNLPWIPMGRLGNPEEISAAVCYLLSPAASFITGTTMIVDGGEILHNRKWPVCGVNNSEAYSWETDNKDGGPSYQTMETGGPKSKL